MMRYLIQKYIKKMTILHYCSKPTVLFACLSVFFFLYR